MGTPVGSVTDSGVITFTDLDLTDVHLVSAVGTPIGTPLGSLTATKDADTTESGTGGQLTWTYTVPASAIEYLADGQTKVESFSITLDDQHGSIISKQIDVTITGTNELPIITAEDLAGAVTELGTPVGALTDSGIITFSDADATDVHLVSATGTPIGTTLGTLTAAKNADTTGTGVGGQLTWTYTVPASAVEYLAMGQTRVESFTITLNDQHGGVVTRQIDVTITGTNDAPLIAGQDLTGAVTEAVTPAGNLTDSGIITFTDVDSDDVHLVSAIGNPLGTPLGSLTAVKNTDTTGTGVGGQLTWTYTVPASAIEYLAAGQTKVESFSITLTDQNGSTITKQIDVTVTGTNDVPMIVAEDLVGAVTELVTPVGNLTNSGVITFTDVDLTDVHLVSGAGTPIGTPLGSLSAVKNADTTGTGAGGQLTWTYTVPASAVEYLKAGQTRVESFTIALSDQHGGTVTRQIDVTIAGTNDAPVAVADVASAVEAGGVNNGTAGTDPSGNVLTNDTDVDTGDTKTVTDFSNSSAVHQTPGSALAGLYGTLTLNADGSYTYVVNNANPTVQALNAGQTLTETFQYVMADGSSAPATSTLTVTIGGRNDNPVANPDVNAIIEDAVPVSGNVLTGAGADTDVDSPASTVSRVNGVAGNVGTAVAGVYGTVNIQTNGSYTYTANLAAAQALRSGQVVTDVFSYTIVDNKGATSTTNLTVTVTGVNDAPVANDVSGAGHKTDTSIAVTLVATDVDTTVSHFKIGDLAGVTPFGTLYQDAGLTQVVGANDVIAATGNQLVLYFKPDYDTGNTGAHAYEQNRYVAGTPTFVFQAIDADAADHGNLANAQTLGTATIAVDDVPYAKQGPDAVVVENFTGQTTNTVSGNLLTGGADFGTGVDWPGTTSAVVNQVRYTAVGGGTATASVTNAIGHTFVTNTGALFVKPDGTYTFTPGRLDHPADGAAIDALFEYNIKDANGDVSSNWAVQKISIADGAEPTITGHQDLAFTEASLPTGTTPNPALTVKTGTLAVTNGTDTTDITFASDQPIDTLIGLLGGGRLSSGGLPVSYTITNSGHTLTAVDSLGATVFSVVILNPSNPAGTPATYQFTLVKPLDHGTGPGSVLENDVNPVDTILDLGFKLNVKDTDDPDVAGEVQTRLLTVSITDDAPVAQMVSLNEGGTAVFNSNADATQSNTSIGGTPTGTSFEWKVAHGKVSVDATGKIVYIADADYSGSDSFNYVTTLDSGGTTTTRVDVTVNPIADAPDLGTDKTGANRLSTWEDLSDASGTPVAAVSLGLKDPATIKSLDQTDQNAADADRSDPLNDASGERMHDSPERLGYIRISGIPNGAILQEGTNTVFTGSPGNSTIYIYIKTGGGALDTSLHAANLPTAGLNVIGLTSAQYQALTFTPAANSGTDVSLVVTAHSYEVNDSGNAVFAGGGTYAEFAAAGATQNPFTLAYTVTPGVDTQTIEIDVQAVTDPISLTAAGATGVEDQWIRIDNTLTMTHADTTDLSEKYNQITLSNLPAGTTVKYSTDGGVTFIQGVVVEGAYTFSPGMTATLPQIFLLPPAHSSLDMAAVQISITVQDTDVDSVGVIGTETAVQTFAVTVTPALGDITLTQDTSLGQGQGYEDTSFALGLKFTNLDPNSEAVTRVTFTNIPAGGSICKADGTVLITSTGTASVYTLTPGVDPVNLTDIQALTFLPPQDANGTFLIKVSADIRDYDDDALGGAGAVTGTTTVVDIPLVVIGTVDTTHVAGDQMTEGLAEVTGAPYQGRLYTAYDGTITDSSSLGSEISLGCVGEDQTAIDLKFTFESSETRDHATVDGSETARFILSGTGLSAGLSFLVVDKNNPGMTLGYKQGENWVLTEAEMESAAIRPPAGRSGDFTFKIETTVTESDAVTPDSKTQTDYFKIVLTPVLDQPQIAVSEVFTQEDMAVQIDIRPLLGDLDGSETVTKVILGSIPDGAVVRFGAEGTVLAQTENTLTFEFGITAKPGGGTFSAADLANLYITPPLHANGPTPHAPYVLTVTPYLQESVDGVPYGVPTAMAPLSLGLHVAGVVDARVYTVTADNFSGAQAIGDFTTPIVYQGNESVAGDGGTGGMVRIHFQASTADQLLTAAGSETIAYVIEGVPRDFRLVDQNGALVGQILATAGAAPKTTTWSVTNEQIGDLYLKAPPDYSGSVTGIRITTTVFENDGACKTDAPVAIQVNFNPVIDTTAMSAAATGFEDDGNPAAGGSATPILVTLAGLQDAVGTYASESISSFKIPIASVGTAKGIDLYVNDGTTWKIAADYNDATHVDLRDGSGNYEVVAYKTTGIGVGVIPGGSLEHVHVEDGSLKILGAVITVTDSAAGLTSATQDFSLDIPITLTGKADAPHIANFSIDTVSTAYNPSGNDYPLSISVTFPDQSTDSADHHETQFFTIQAPTTWKFTAGSYNGDGTWYFTKDELVDLFIEVQDEESGDLILKAYSAENGTLLDTASLHIDDPRHGPNLPNPGQKNAQNPSLSVIDGTSATEDQAFTLSQVVNAAGTHTNDNDGLETLSLTLHPISHATISGPGVIAYQYAPDPAQPTVTQTMYRIPVIGGDVATALAGVTITPEKDFSGDLALTIVATATETLSGVFSTSTITSMLTVHVNPVADDISVTGNMGVSGKIVEDTLAAVKFTLTSQDTQSDAIDQAEVIKPGTYVTIQLIEDTGHFKGHFTDSTGTINMTDTVIVKKGAGDTWLRASDDQQVFYIGDSQGSGTPTIKVTAEMQDATTGLVTSTIIQDASFTVTVTPSVDGLDVLSVDTLHPGNSTYTAPEDTAVDLKLEAKFGDNDGSEIHTVLISGAPDGSVFSAGTRNADGTWAFQVKQNPDGSYFINELAGLTFTRPANWHEPINLILTAKSMESDQLWADDPQIAVSQLAFTVNVTPVADGAIITPQQATGNEDQFVPFALGARIVEQLEMDNSPLNPDPANPAGPFQSNETYHLAITGVGEHAEFYVKDGAANFRQLTDLDVTDSGYLFQSLSQYDMDNLHVVVGKNFTGVSTFEVAVSTRDGASANSPAVIGTIAITTSAVAGDDVLTSVNAVDGVIYGHSGNDTITGSAGDDIIMGGSGNDRITGGGGQDTIDGGVGTDTLLLASGENLDFGAVDADHLSNMEIIDLGPNGNHSILNFGVNELLQTADPVDKTLTIFGDAGDQVDLHNGHGADWTSAGTSTIDSHTFNVYYSSVDPQVTLMLEQGIVVVPPHNP
jgi:VCBS repeat-containing protein